MGEKLEPYKSSNLSFLEQKFTPLMVDPSVLTSDAHVKTLYELKDKLYFPSTVYRLLYEKNEEINKVLPFFVWPFMKTPTISRYCADLKPRIIPYTAKPRFAEEISFQLKESNLPQTVGEILLEEYSFMREQSALALRLRRTINHFRRLGIVTLDTTNRLKNLKVKAFYRLQGLTWIMSILLETSGIEQLVQGDPIWSQLFRGIKVILIVIDP